MEGRRAEEFYPKEQVGGERERERERESERERENASKTGRVNLQMF